MSISDILKRADLSVEQVEAVDKCESPIETKLVKLLQQFAVPVQTQRPIGKYRADIYIELDGNKLVVECDGKAYHSTEKQKEHDSKRDRFMGQNGCTVLRFSGSEIYNTPEMCAIRVIEELSSIYQSIKFQDWLQEYLDGEVRLLRHD